jgi:lactoylglutathione lyase
MKTLHTAFRVADLERSVDFYEAIGFQQVGQVDASDEITLAMFNMRDDGDVARLELVFNHGVDSHEVGDGFSHLGVSVDDIGRVPGWPSRGSRPRRLQARVTPAGILR